MDIKILEETDSKIVVEMIGKDHTLCNAIKKELHNDSKVKNATYYMEHPATSHPKMIVETTGKEPRKALADAASKLKKQINELKKEAEKELK